MKILITGICGFAGASLARALVAAAPDTTGIRGIDNLWRPGSEINRDWFRRAGIPVTHGDIRMASDLDGIGDVDWVIDAAAHASVLAGVDGATSSRQLVEHNVLGTINILEFCRARDAGCILLSTSRVYSIAALAGLPLRVERNAFTPAAPAGSVTGLEAGGITEKFSTAAPVSLYGATKLASEQLALDYGAAFDFPVWINRCGVLAGAGQFGQPAQGIFSYWINAYLRRQPLRYLGFGGSGHQVRDCLHPADLAALVRKQMARPRPQGHHQIQNVSGGVANSMSLAQLSVWCAERFGPHDVAGDATERPFDLPWVVLDHGRASAEWHWQPEIPLNRILDEIADHAEQHPEWLSVSRP